MSIFSDFQENFGAISATIAGSASITTARAEYTSTLSNKQIAPNKYAELMMDFEFKIAQMVTNSALQMMSSLMQVRGAYERATYFAEAKAPIYLASNGVYYSVSSSGAITNLSEVSSYEAEFAKMNHDVKVTANQADMVSAQIAYQTAQTLFTTDKTTVMKQSRIDTILKDTAQIKSDFIGMIALGGAVPTAGDFAGHITVIQALADRISSPNGNPITTISMGTSAPYSSL